MSRREHTELAKMEQETPVEFFLFKKWHKGTFVLYNEKCRSFVVRDKLNCTWHVAPEGIKLLKVMDDDNPNQAFRRRNYDG